MYYLQKEEFVKTNNNSVLSQGINRTGENWFVFITAAEETKKKHKNGDFNEKQAVRFFFF